LLFSCSGFLLSAAAPIAAALMAAVAILLPLAPVHDPGSLRSRKASTAAALAALFRLPSHALLLLLL